MSAPTQPEPAEGPRDPAAPNETPDRNISPEAPAEGGDDIAPPQPGSPRG